MRHLLFVIIVFQVGCSTNQGKGDSFSFNLDVPAERYSSWNYQNIDKKTSIYIEGAFIENRKTPEWNPSASFQLISEDGNQIAAVVLSNRESQEYQVFMAVKSRDAETGNIASIDPLFFSNRINYREDFTLKISWGASNNLVVSLNDSETKTIPIEFSIGDIRVSSSSGELEVTHMLISN